MSASVAEQVISTSPVFGFGISGWQVAYDSTWIEALVLSGLVGVGISAFVFVVLIAKAVGQIRRPPRSALLLILTTCAILASLGIGSLTANRASTIFWILVTLSAFGGFKAASSARTGLERPRSGHPG